MKKLSPLKQVLAFSLQLRTRTMLCIMSMVEEPLRTGFWQLLTIIIRSSHSKMMSTCHPGTRWVER
jgi:hypothetical protein